MNIILVSRTLSKLQTVAKEIEETFNVETAVIDVDFTSGPEIYNKIKERVKSKEIGVLVNNVGISNKAPDMFLESPDREQLIQDIIRCNITSVSMMCSIVLPQMVQRQKGIIINISSLCALLVSGEIALYAASKAFVHKFTQDLTAEYEHQGIIIQSVLPGPVATNMTNIKNGNLFAPKAKTYVSSAIKTVGFAEYTTGYFPHSLMVLAAKFSFFVFPTMLKNFQRKFADTIRNREIETGRYNKK